MKVKVGKKYLNVNLVYGFFDKLKSLKFVLETIEEVFLFPNCKAFNTYFFCQRVDIIMTDVNNKILYMYPKIKTEKRIHYKRKVHNTYIFPLDSCKEFKIGDTLVIKEK